MAVSFLSLLSFLLILFYAVFTKPVVCTTEIDVLILGAGISGMTAANHLQKSGVESFLVLEAQDYIGGRIKQFYIGNITVGEGANWVHWVEEGDENPIHVLANKINLETYKMRETDRNLRDTKHTKEDFEKTLKTFTAITAKVIEENEENPRNMDQPLSSVLAANGWLPDTPLKRTVEWYLDFEYALKPALISALHYTGLPEENDLVTDNRGFKGIIDYLAQNVTNKIKTEKVVTQIKYDSSGIEIKTQNGETYKAKYGLCTFSTGVLATDLVEFIPELPKWKKEAISRIPLTYYTNTFVKFPNAFWDDSEFIFNAGSLRETFPLLYNLNIKGIQKGSNILLFTAVEDDALRIEGQSKNETKDEIMKTLREMYPNVTIPEPTEIYVGQFSRNPYVRGAYGNGVVGSTAADFHNLQGRLGDLFFAGEATDEDYWGYSQGGYLTGLKAAKAILKCLNGKECPEYRPENADIVCPKSGSVKNIGKSSFVCILLAIVYGLFNF